jgi:phosphoglucosamine mutase
MNPSPEKKLFGTDGMRGIPGEFPLDDETLRRVGCALGAALEGNELDSKGQNRRVVFGMDTRESGPHIARQVAAGLTSVGVELVDAGVITTPGVAWLVKNEGFDAGIVISASHNPYTDNGVKLISRTGMKFPDEFEAGIEQRMGGVASPEKIPPLGEAAGDRLREDYLNALSHGLLEGARLGGMKVVLDCANGAASDLAPKLFRRLGAEVVPIHNRPDGRNINVGSGSLHPESMMRKVKENGAELGVAFDGDADRAIFSTASGKRMDGDGVLLCMARYMKSAGRLRVRTIVGTTMANLGLERGIERAGLTLARVPVGDRYVLEEMLRTGANLGGEQSGHILFLDDATTGDGMLTALKIASLVALEGPLDNLVADLRVFPQTIVNVRVKTKPELESLPEVKTVFEAARAALGERGRIVLRYSGTELLARVMVEAEREEDVSRWSESIAQAIRDSIGA